MNPHEHTVKKSAQTSYWPLLTLCVFLLAFFGAYWWLADERLLPATESMKYSDIFASFSAIVSALAFGGLIYTFSLQRRELQLQREELEATRQELAGQKEQLSLQTQTFQDQSFENTFFQLVNLHHRIVEGIRIGQPGYDHRGRDAFETMYNELTELLREHEAITQAEIREQYKDFGERYRSQIGHYFKNLYYVFRFIEDSRIAHKMRYVWFMGAQLSEPELLMWFYGTVEYERGDFPVLIDKYSLFHNMPTHRLVHPSHRELFSERSYTFSPENYL